MNRLPVIILLLFAFSAPALADTTFEDHTFNLADYSLITFSSDSSVSHALTQCPACGNPGNGLMLAVTFPSGYFDITALINSTFAYDPQSQGAIASLTVSGDKILSTNLPVSSGDAFGIRILQDGKIYTRAIPGPDWNGLTSGWVSFFQSGMTADMFLEYDFVNGTVGAGHPDFAGNTMWFGFGTRTTTFFPLVVTNVWDNVRFDIHTVPEPGSMVLLGSGLLAAAGAIRRRFPA